MQSLSQQFGSTMSTAMQELVLQGKKFDEVLRNVANRLASKAFDNLFDIFFKAQAGGGGSIFTQLLGLTAKQHGGPVAAGGAYMVGERGPELFVPNQGGMIVPNTGLMGRGNAVNMGGLSFNVDARGATPGAAEEIVRRLRAEIPGIAVASVAQAQRYRILR